MENAAYLLRAALSADNTQSRMCRDALHTAGQYGHKNMGGMRRLRDAVAALANACTSAADRPAAMDGLQAAACGAAYELALTAQSGSWILAAAALDHMQQYGKRVTALPIPAALTPAVLCRYKLVPTGARVQNAVYELLYAAGKPGIGKSAYIGALETAVLYSIITSAAYEAATQKGKQDGSTEM